ncbi:MAG: 3-deoxy-manno-octulosonate cytidylyltransferase [Acidobacteriota bacterium]|nr:MAG: 3-deoxy-manno-octulosonate cytidylyltransferase [Acidobacteriota bacterium]
MEHHGNLSSQNVIAVIPARYSSTRLPGKMLAEIGGLPMVVLTAKRAVKASLVDRVIVATDDDRVAQAAAAHGFEAVMTSPYHASGSDRIAEVAEGLPAGSIIVNVQGDEPLISAETIDHAVEAMLRSDADIVTTSESIDSVDDIFDSNIVKAVVGEDGNAVYFSRSPVPYLRDAAMLHGGDLRKALMSEPQLLSAFRKHTGLYVYRREYLLEFTKMPQSRLEKLEMLEQLRALENGARIMVVNALERSIGVDSEADLERVRGMFTGG